MVVVQGLFAKYLDKAQSKLKHRQMCLKMAGDWVDGFFLDFPEGFENNFHVSVHLLRNVVHVHDL